MNKTIKYLLLVFLAVWGYSALAQTELNFVKFSYDKAGNRIERVTLDSLTLTSQELSVLRTASLLDDEPADSSYISEANEDFMFANVEDRSIKVFPNPTKGKFAIQISPAPAKGSKVYLYNSNGKLLDKRRNIAAIEEFDLSHRRPGLFMLILKIEKQEYSLKIIRN